ncbi:hypothetical protein BST92_13840 [Nonlabens arenilitoris]|uniref:DUF4834 domain-containing protein n=1 Tax=Nonlabens arenilitoris TaxID=1217969 RepID=A0A2S7UDB3_9FLAO|nr:DUF4834 family protein [Nonlabens arenilitoris]PQJ32938.1 hypothetical protein BST92_13840 [Nonlabens arenilitoris]
MKLLQVILIVLVIYVSVRLILKYYGASILKWLGKKAMQRMSRSFEKRSGMNTDDLFNQSQGPRSSQKKVNKPKENKTVGEYVDFEEID